MLIASVLGIGVAFVLAETDMLCFVAKVKIAKFGVGMNIAEQVLDTIEPNLIRWCEEMSLPYIRPVLTQNGKKLLLDSPAHFVRAYIGELRSSVRDNCNFVEV